MSPEGQTHHDAAFLCRERELREGTYMSFCKGANAETGFGSAVNHTIALPFFKLAGFARSVGLVGVERSLLTRCHSSTCAAQNRVRVVVYAVTERYKQVTHDNDTERGGAQSSSSGPHHPPLTTSRHSGVRACATVFDATSRQLRVSSSGTLRRTPRARQRSGWKRRWLSWTNAL